MKRFRPTARLRLSLLLLGTGMLLAPVAGAQEAGAPDTAETPETIWTFLSGKYDADGDGVVSREEYTRPDDTFARLDKNGASALDESDFSVDDRPGGGMPSGRMGEMILQRYFDQVEDGGLARTEVQTAHASFDSNADGRIARAEFEKQVEARNSSPDDGDDRMGGMMGSMRFDRFSSLLEVADANDDLNLSLEELLAWFDKVDSDGNGIWTRGGGMGSRDPAPEDGAEQLPVEDTAPAAEGKLAPDFELQPPHDGKPVKLSSFVDDRPVALIFGSYT
jgi:hypothetical protein